MRLVVFAVFLVLLPTAAVVAFGPCPSGGEVVERRTAFGFTPGARIPDTFDVACLDEGCRATWCAKRVDGELLKHGRFTSRYANGGRYFEGHYLEGRRHGHWKAWFQNGRTSYTGQWRHGRRIGRWRLFHLDGTLSAEETYRRGQLHGRRTHYFFRGGGKSFEGYYEHGRIVGQHRYWNRDGTRDTDREIGSSVIQ